MNAQLKAALDRLVAAKGQEVLHDAQYLDENLPVFANKEAQAERTAFLQNVRSRPPVPPSKTHVQERSPAPPQPPPVSQPTEATAHPAKGFALSKRTAVFAAVSAIAALAAYLAYRTLFPSNYGSDGELILQTAFWMGLTTLAIIGAILGAQSFYLKKAPAGSLIVTALAVGTVCGAVAGGLAQAIFNYTQHVSPTVSAVSRVFCWGLAGAGTGFGVSFFVPNYPRGRAFLAGFLGGVAGGIVCVLGSGLIGVTILGLCIGAAIVIVEESLREAWITVDWGRNETVNVSLGATPVSLGSAPEASVHLSAQSYPPVALVVSIEGQKVIADNRIMGQRVELPNGGIVDLGRVKVIAHKRQE